MDADIKKLYTLLHGKYPLELKSSKEMGFKGNIDFPVLCGISGLGIFELFHGDLDFEFYSMKENGEFLTHFHLQSIDEAKRTVAYFMEEKLTQASFE